MKTHSLFLAFLFSLFFAASYAQTKTDTVQVSGNCGSCKKRIEAAAKEAGATSANWNKDTKKLIVSYSPTTTSLKTIEQKIADSGYDTQNIKASDSAYKKLDECCQYERKQTALKKCCAQDCKDMTTCCKNAEMSCCSKESMAKNTCCTGTGCSKM